MGAILPERADAGKSAAPACLSPVYLLAFFPCPSASRNPRSLGTEAGRRRRSPLARYLATRYQGPPEEDAQGRSQPVQALPPANGPVMEPPPWGSTRIPLERAMISRRCCAAAASWRPSPCRLRTRPPRIRRGSRRRRRQFSPSSFNGGVLVAGDRRATAGNTVVYDRADKVLEIDRHSIMAIAGVPATAWEMARVLEHSFQFFRRTQLQEMSVDGKVRALSKLLRDNFGFVLQGVGVVVPIFATYDPARIRRRGFIFTTRWARNLKWPITPPRAPGRPAVRGILYYENNWGKKPLARLGGRRGGHRGLARPGHRRRIGYSHGRSGSKREDLSGHQDCVRDGITTLPEKRIAALFKRSVA